jgi:hypothetical protein
MALNPKFADALVNAQAVRTLSLLAAGKVIVYGGAQPPTANTVVTSQTLIAQGTLANPAGTQASGTMTFTVPINIASIAATSVAAWFRLFQSDDTPMADGSAGVGTFDMVFTGTASLTAGLPLTISAVVLTIPKG